MAPGWRGLRDRQRACPIRIRTILTDNGKEFTDRLFGLRKRAATGAREFDRLCAELGIEHRLTPPKSPRANGMVERFNGRIEAVLQGNHIRSGEDMETTPHRYVRLTNQQLPQSALGSKTPLQAMKDWHKLKPQLSRKQPHCLPGCDSLPIPDPHICLADSESWIRRHGTPESGSLQHALVLASQCSARLGRSARAPIFSPRIAAETAARFPMSRAFSGEALVVLMSRPGRRSARCIPPPCRARRSAPGDR
jgi:hypothetical protein